MHRVSILILGALIATAASRLEVTAGPLEAATGQLAMTDHATATPHPPGDLEVHRQAPPGEGLDSQDPRDITAIIGDPRLSAQSGSVTSDSADAPDRQAELHEKPVETTGSLESGDQAANAERLTPAPTNPFVGHIKALLAKSAGKTRAGRKDLLSVKKFYKLREYEPIWVTDGRLNDRARHVTTFLQQVDSYGLDPRAYNLPVVDSLPMLDMAAHAADYGRAESDIEAEQRITANEAAMRTLSAAEISLSTAALAYARHAYAGRTKPSTVSPSISFSPKLPNRMDVLKDLAEHTEPKQILASLNPPHPAFEVLRHKLSELKHVAEAGGWAQIDPGPTLRLGDRSVRVIQLKERLGIPMPPPLIADPSEVERFDETVAEAVKQFQHAHGLVDDGIVGNATLTQLNVSAVDRIYQVLATMEQWRWIPRDLGKFHVLVDVPGFRARVIDNDQLVHEARVVVGKQAHQTPIFSDYMEYIVVNPYWNVPNSIATAEILPEILSDPYYFARNDFEVLPLWGAGNRPINPYTINWYAVDPNNFPYRFRQQPGRSNALGRIKFMFPNKHDVYLHDTPSKRLFSRQRRLFSHGCVRVNNPLTFAKALLSGEKKLTVSQLNYALNRQDNQTLPLGSRIPVHLTYFTAWVESGDVIFREDVYGHDLRVAAALGWR